MSLFGSFTMPNGYEITYESVRKKLADCDFHNAIKYLGFEKTGRDSIKIDFMNREYEISREDVIPLDDRYVDVNVLSVLIYYAVSVGKVEPLYRFSLLKNFTKGMFSGSEFSLNWMSAPLTRKFSKDYNLFKRTAQKIGMELISEKNSSHTWLYFLLPKIPIQLVYYEEDDEYPCDIQIMYDLTASDYLEFEPQAFLTGCFIREFISVEL